MQPTVHEKLKVSQLDELSAQSMPVKYPSFEFPRTLLIKIEHSFVHCKTSLESLHWSLLLYNSDIVYNFVFLQITP